MTFTLLDLVDMERLDFQMWHLDCMTMQDRCASVGDAGSSKPSDENSVLQISAAGPLDPTELRASHRQLEASQRRLRV